MLSTGKKVWLLNVIAQFFSAIEGGQSTHNDRTTARNSMQELDKANMM